MTDDVLCIQNALSVSKWARNISLIILKKRSHLNQASILLLH